MHKRNGLALLVALMLMAMLLAAALALATLASVELGRSQAVLRVHRLRFSAENAARRGFAELQASLGPDAAHTFEDATGRLVGAGGNGQACLVGEADEEAIRVSWRVEDLALGYDVAAASVAASQASRWARSSAGRAKLPQALASSVDAGQAVALAVGGRAFFRTPAQPGTSWQVRGLLTDPVRGGWRRDLAAEEVLAAEVGRPIAEALRSPAFAQVAPKGYPLARLHGSRHALATLPVLTDFRLSLGIFNARSDGRHRLRFHGSMVFWNRLTVPVLAAAQGKLFLVEVLGSPEVTVTNLETASSFTTDLDECPQEDFGVIRQGARERGLWFWAEVADPSTYGMSARGLLPGEVYALVTPSPVAQPQGLARILTRQTWKMERGYHGPTWRRPDPTVFLPTDRIEIAFRFRGKVGLRLRPYAGEPQRDDLIGEYPASPVLSWDNITFPDFMIRTTGEDYSREDSAGYVIGERRACLRIRLKPRPAGELWSVAAAGRLTKPNWDFALPADLAQWEVAQPVLAALDVADHDMSPLMGPLWDLRVNRHAAEEAGAYASVRLLDLPGWPCLSADALRHLQPAEATDIGGRADRLFSSAPLAAPESGVVSHNPFLIAAPDAPLAASEPASRLRVVGPFNVNTREVAAWQAFLGGASGPWRPDAGGPFEPVSLAGPLFFTRPHGAVLAKGGAMTPVDVVDREAAALPETPLVGLSGQQAVRAIEKEKLGELARKLVELQPSHGWPYPSIEAFARSRLLERALAETGINQPYAAMPSELPVLLKAEDLLEAWAPVLTVRGDTFKVVGQAVGHGGACLCEMVVQREAEEHQAAHLGRKFRIISVRFRNP